MNQYGKWKSKGKTKGEKNLLKNTFIVIPSYNEEKSIQDVISSLRKAGYSHIVVVDDCSSDKTYKILRQQPSNVVHVLRHAVNRGQGASLKTGIDYAISQGADIIVTFDADGQHQPQDIAVLIDPIMKGKADVVLGSRFLAGTSEIPWLRAFVLKLGVLFTFFYSGISLTDTHNGLRALSRHAAEQVEIRHDRMEHASEIIDEIQKKKLAYCEVPVTIRYTEYSQQKGQSTLNSVKIAWNLIIRKLLS
ncbi:glycosyltransferase family 2 protein [Candidatus Woesearchaeota archaeon]|nr:glycosyltransferase family 2 protein [Candidatus Woesearchaeota archaeon]